MPTVTTLPVQDAKAVLRQRRADGTKLSHMRLRRYTEADLRAALYRPDDRVRTLAEIGALYGVSRERIRQVLQAYGIQKPKANFANALKCLDCGKTMYKPGEKKRGYCPGCWIPRKPTPLSQQMLTIICFKCAKPFSISQYDFNHRTRRRTKAPGLFCTRSCAVRWIGKYCHKGKTTLKNLLAALYAFLADISTLTHGHEVLALASCDRLQELTATMPRGKFEQEESHVLSSILARKERTP